ncbi:MAG: Cytosol aminopeptidase PepA [uncultured Thermomicrobiales bacterium]|uniref:Probable cytosol aminopeptidase n=1 Tax=uncultured Thermomicrobiales bacterium TaxID=1645740 RepID=A0A6J4UAD5_9BACT|nr:MAG: Cytosol aminopeptidase PepA [uncultured Thermomicrobiales bacterium]
MNVSYATGDPLAEAADATIVPVGTVDGKADPAHLAAVDRALAGELARLVAEARFTGSLGSTMAVSTLGHMAPRRLVLTGVGAADAVDRRAITRAWGAAAVAARDAGASAIVSSPPPTGTALTPDAALAAGAEGVRIALYRFDTYRGAGRGDGPTKEVASCRFIGGTIPDGEAARALILAEAIAAGVALARDLVNEPANVLNPEAMAERARRVAAASNLEIEVLGVEDLAEIGAGAITAVGRGSANGPRLIRLRYRPNAEDAEPVANAGTAARVVGLVGKCITFDTGGYSIKTYEGMLEMKGDMAGGAAVLGTMSALRALRCPVAVDATICAAENMISGEAFRPGDVLTAMNGVTIEVLSTDAEGRLVLADGLVDAARRGATELIDLATLTGAAVVALGEGTTALFASDDPLADRLLRAAALTGERAWRMPLIEELNEKIKGDVGDIKNTGGRGGGAITAALFLQRFSEGLPWAHFDIAGSARSAKGGPAGPKGATGVGVRTLLAYLTQPSA